MDSAQHAAIIQGVTTILGAAAGGGGIAWYSAWQGRRDRDREARRAEASDTAARDRELWERLEGDNDDLRERLTAAGRVIEQLRRQVRRWEDLARWWSRRAHDLNHALLSARFGARRVLEEAGRPVPEAWDRHEELPALEAPIPDDSGERPSS